MAEGFQSPIIKALGVNEDLGLVFGWGIISTEQAAGVAKREPYFDTQGDHITPDRMLEKATDFMAHSRATDDQHDAQASGIVVHSFPLTAEIAKAYGIDCPIEGWMIAAAPPADILAKFVSGEYTGFSIGGVRISDVPAQEALTS